MTNADKIRSMSDEELFIIMIVASVIVSTIFGKPQNVAQASGFRRSFGCLVDVVCSIMFFAGIVGVIYILVFA